VVCTCQRRAAHRQTKVSRRCVALPQTRGGGCLHRYFDPIPRPAQNRGRFPVRYRPCAEEALDQIQAGIGEILGELNGGGAWTSPVSASSSRCHQAQPARADEVGPQPTRFAPSGTRLRADLSARRPEFHGRIPACGRSGLSVLRLALLDGPTSSQRL